MSALFPLTLTLLLGILTGFIVRKKPAIIRAADNTALISIYVLLFILGSSLGANATLFAKLPELGLTAFYITLFCSAGSAGCAMLVTPFFSLPPSSARVAAMSVTPGAALWGTLRVFSFFAVGVGLARFGVIPLWLCDAKFAEYALWALIYTVSITIGNQLHVFGIIKQLHIKIFLVPLATIIGTCAGALLAAALLPLNSKETLSVGAGFSYYSITSIIIAESGNPSLASIALLANIFRELAGLLTTPFLARWCGPFAPIAVAGATAMDTCLPMISKYSGEQAAIIAVLSGIFFTFAAPFCVALIIYW